MCGKKDYLSMQNSMDVPRILANKLKGKVSPGQPRRRLKDSYYIDLK